MMSSGADVGHGGALAGMSDAGAAGTPLPLPLPPEAVVADGASSSTSVPTANAPSRLRTAGGWNASNASETSRPEMFCRRKRKAGRDDHRAHHLERAERQLRRGVRSERRDARSGGDSGARSVRVGARCGRSVARTPSDPSRAVRVRAIRECEVAREPPARRGGGRAASVGRAFAPGARSRRQGGTAPSSSHRAPDRGARRSATAVVVVWLVSLKTVVSLGVSSARGPRAPRDRASSYMCTRARVRVGVAPPRRAETRERRQSTHLAVDREQRLARRGRGSLELGGRVGRVLLLRDRLTALAHGGGVVAAGECEVGALAASLVSTTGWIDEKFLTKNLFHVFRKDTSGTPCRPSV